MLLIKFHFSEQHDLKLFCFWKAYKVESNSKVKVGATIQIKLVLQYNIQHEVDFEIVL